MTTRKRPSRPGRKPVSLLMLEPREIGAAEFKARCLEIMDEVARTGVEVTVTKHRKPVARIVPAVDTPGGFCGSMKGWVVSWTDLISPLDVELDVDLPARP